MDHVRGPARTSPGPSRFVDGRIRPSAAPTAGQIEQLALSEATVDPVRTRHQLGVGADFHDTTTMDDNNTIRVLDAGEPMGDEQDGPAPHELGQRLLDEELALGVEI